VIGSYLQAQKRTRPIMVLEIGKVVGILLLVPTVGSFGPLWACVAVGITYAIHALASVWLVRRTDGVPMKNLLLPLVRPLAACGVMVGAIVGVRRLLGAFDVDHPGLGLGVELCVGAVAFIAAALVVAKDASGDMLGLVRRSRKKETSIPPE
jgi:PST family polysaccharide transporter